MENAEDNFVLSECAGILDAGSVNTNSSCAPASMYRQDNKKKKNTFIKKNHPLHIRAGDENLKNGVIDPRAFSYTFRCAATGRFPGFYAIHPAH